MKELGDKEEIKEVIAVLKRIEIEVKKIAEAIESKAESDYIKDNYQ